MPSYLRNSFSDAGLVTDYRDWQIPLGRRFRALKIWFVLRSFGVDALKAFIREHIRLGLLFADWIRSRPDLFDVLVEPRFALTVLTIRPPARRGQVIQANRPDPRHEDYSNDFTPDAAAQYTENANRLTKEVYEAVNSKGEVFLTSSVIKGVYAIRVVSATMKTEEKWLRKCFDNLVQIAEEVVAKEAGEEGIAKGGAFRARL